MNAENQKIALAALDAAFADSVKNTFRVLMAANSSRPAGIVDDSAVRHARNGLILAARTRDDLAAIIQERGQDVSPKV